MTDYDSAWKEICDDFFGDMLSFFLPDIYLSIDWDKEVMCRDKELVKIAEDHETGDRLADKLMALSLGGASPKKILVHIEFQNQYDAKLPLRMYTYNYRVFDKFQVKVMSLAFLGDRSKSWRPDCYQQQMCGFDLKMEYRIVKLIDYRDKMTMLATSPSPMPVVLAAHFAGQETQNDAEQRLREKLILAERLYQKDFSRDTVISLFRFIDRVLPLPPTQAEHFHRELELIEGAVNMPYITSIERLGYERGREEGRVEGREEGRVEGREEGREEGRAEGHRLAQVTNVTKLLTHQFGPLPDIILAKIQQADLATLNTWFDQGFSAKNLRALFPD